MKHWRQRLLVAAVAGWALVALATPESKPAVTDERNTETGQTDRADDEPKPALDGAKVFSWYCGSCHSERYPRERTDAEWDVIVTHMRVRANLTVEQTEAVLRYLKENNE